MRCPAVLKEVLNGIRVTRRTVRESYGLALHRIPLSQQKKK